MRIEDGADEHLSRFVVLEHQMPATHSRRSHWDFMVERQSGLWTWELQRLPTEVTLEVPQNLVVRRLSDHRLDYLDYEGAVSGERGHVRRVAGGRAALRPTPKEVLKMTLSAPTLEAELAVALCPVGGLTTITIYRWRWLEP